MNKSLIVTWPDENGLLLRYPASRLDIAVPRFLYPYLLFCMKPGILANLHGSGAEVEGNQRVVLSASVCVYTVVFIYFMMGPSPMQNNQ